jgi:hypothetical protein
MAADFLDPLPPGFATPGAAVEAFNESLARNDRSALRNVFTTGYWISGGQEMAELFDMQERPEFFLRLVEVEIKGDRAVARIQALREGELEGEGYFLLFKVWNGGWLVAATPDMDDSSSRELADAFLQSRAPYLRD